MILVLVPEVDGWINEQPEWAMRCASCAASLCLPTIRCACFWAKTKRCARLDVANVELAKLRYGGVGAAIMATATG